jgi:hypothetical protein
MLTLIVLAVLLAGVFYYVQTYSESAKPLLEKVKKVEAEIKAVVDVNQDGKIDIKDVDAATEVVKKVRKPRTTKKIAGKKKKNL